MNAHTPALASGSSPNFRALFESLPGLHLSLALDFSIVAVSDAYFKATQTTREALLGRDIFSSELTGPIVHALRASIDHVRQSRGADTMAVQKLKVRKSHGEGLEQRTRPEVIFVNIHPTELRADLLARGCRPNLHAENEAVC